jgi:hypothetical protein
MHRSLMTLGILLFAVAAMATPVRKLSSPPAADTTQASPLAEQLKSLEKALPEAQKKHDRDFYSSTLTDDFISIGTDGKVHPKSEIMGDFPSTQLAEYRIYNMQVVPLNDNAAVVTYDVIVRMVHYDDETPRYQHDSSVWVKQGDRWKLKFQQATAAT